MCHFAPHLPFSSSMPLSLIYPYSFSRSFIYTRLMSSLGPEACKPRSIHPNVAHMRPLESTCTCYTNGRSLLMYENCLFCTTELHLTCNTLHSTLFFIYSIYVFVILDFFLMQIQYDSFLCCLKVKEIRNNDKKRKY